MRVDFSRIETLGLNQKVDFIQNFYQDVLFDSCGIARCMQKIDGDEVRAFRESDFAGCRVPDFAKWGRRPPANAAGYYTCENSITTSGLYLAAQAYRYKVMREAAALEECRRAFNSLRIIYRMNVEDGNAGFMSKPYGFAISDETSGDQYLHCLYGLLNYLPFAEEATRQQIHTMIRDFADYWASRDDVLNYMGNAWDMKGDVHAYNAIMILIQVAAHHVSGEEKYLAEARKLFTKARWHLETNVDEMKAHSRKVLAALREGQTISKGMMSDKFAAYLKPNEFLFWESNVLSQFVMISADLIERMCPRFIPGGIGPMASRWLDICHYGMGEDYAPYYWYIIDMEKDPPVWRPTGMTEPLPEDQWPFAEKFMSYLSELRWGDPLARFMQVSELAWLHGTDVSKAQNMCMGIMKALDAKRLCWMFDFDGKQLTKDLSHMYNVLSSEIAPTFLLTYWRGRYEKLW